MKPNRVTGAVVGVLFLVAMVASLVGGALIEGVTSAPDYLSNVSANATLSLGMVLEVVNGVAVVAIGFLLFSILKQHGETMALGYLSFRIIEAVFLIVAAIAPLSLIALSRQVGEADGSGASGIQAVGALVLAARSDIAGVLIPLFFGLGAVLFYVLLYRSKLVPRFISVWGFVGVTLMASLNLLGVGLPLGLVLAAPIILNEVFLGVWLIARGFDAAAGTSRSARPGLRAA